MIDKSIDNHNLYWPLMLASKKRLRGLRVFQCVPTVTNGHKRLLSEKVVGGQLEMAKVDIGRAVTYDEGVSRQGDDWGLVTTEV